MYMYLYIVHVRWGFFWWGGGSCPIYLLNYRQNKKMLRFINLNKKIIYVKLLQKYRSRYVTNGDCNLLSRWFKCQNEKPF